MGLNKHASFSHVSQLVSEDRCGPLFKLKPPTFSACEPYSSAHMQQHIPKPAPKPANLLTSSPTDSL